MDDAALVCPEGATHALVLTLDVITPIVDDAYTFGSIAAANALSDVYAMGGEPQVALSFVGLPDILGTDVLEAVMRGAAEKCHEAGCAIVGGHTLRDTEPKCGLAVIGTVERERAWTQRRGCAGQVLVLSKAIGTGTVAQALRAGAADAAAVVAATQSMQMLNRNACAAGRRHGVTAATDVTGFGLLGHTHHLAAASGVAVRLRTADVPLLPGALETATAGFLPGGSKRNQRYVAAHLRGADRVDPVILSLLSDAQTSGGLLLVLSDSAAQALVVELGASAAIVGELVAGDAGTIELV